MPSSGRPPVILIRSMVFFRYSFTAYCAGRWLFQGRTRQLTHHDPYPAHGERARGFELSGASDFHAGPPQQPQIVLFERLFSSQAEKARKKREATAQTHSIIVKAEPDDASSPIACDLASPLGKSTGVLTKRADRANLVNADRGYARGARAPWLATPHPLWHTRAASRAVLPIIRRSSGSCLRCAQCCRSSVVEHSLGKGEVESSILSGSTRFILSAPQYKALSRSVVRGVCRSANRRNDHKQNRQSV